MAAPRIIVADTVTKLEDAAGTVVVAGPILGLIGAGAISPAWNIGNSLVQVYRAKKLISVPAPDGGVLRTRLVDVDRIRLSLEQDTLRLYKRWLQTGSQHEADLLVRRGLIPVKAPLRRQ